MRATALMLVFAPVFLLLPAAGCGGSDPCSTPNCGFGGEAATTTTTSETGGSGGSGGQAPTTLVCKGQTCQIKSQACTVTAVPSGGDTGECTSLPLPCLTEGADCTCFPNLDGCTCQAQPGGGFVIFCGFGP